MSFKHAFNFSAAATGVTDTGCTRRMVCTIALVLLCSNVAIAAPVVNGNTISWPADGWYQVQDAATYESLCQGGQSCEVAAGEYIVINHTTGERFENIMVVEGGFTDPAPSGARTG